MSEHKIARREFEKCASCRNDSKKCVMVKGDYRCQRCIAKNRTCGPRLRAKPRTGNSSQVPEELPFSQASVRDATKLIVKPAPQNLACPFLAAGPDVCSVEMREYCLTVVMKDISALKQHLVRKHKKPDYCCENCRCAFTSADDLSSHLQVCEVRYERFTEFMTDDAAKTIQSRQRGLDTLTAWQGIFATLFPSRPVPRTIHAIDVPSITNFSEMFIAIPNVFEATQCYFGLERNIHAPQRTRDILRDAFSVYIHRLTTSQPSRDRSATGNNAQDSVGYHSQQGDSSWDGLTSTAGTLRLGISERLFHDVVSVLRADFDLIPLFTSSAPELMKTILQIVPELQRITMVNFPAEYHSLNNLNVSNALSLEAASAIVPPKVPAVRSNTTETMHPLDAHGVYSDTNQINYSGHLTPDARRDAAPTPSQHARQSIVQRSPNEIDRNRWIAILQQAVDFVPNTGVDDQSSTTPRRIEQADTSQSTAPFDPGDHDSPSVSQAITWPDLNESIDEIFMCTGDQFGNNSSQYMKTTLRAKSLSPKDDAIVMPSTRQSMSRDTEFMVPTNDQSLQSSYEEFWEWKRQKQREEALRAAEAEAAEFARWRQERRRRLRTSSSQLVEESGNVYTMNAEAVAL